MKAVGVMDFAGSFATGVRQAGFDYVAKREPSAFAGFGVTAIEANIPNVQIEVTEPEFWSAVKSDLVFGCPPCSGFSMLSTINTADSKTGKVVDGVRVAQRGVDSPDNAWMYSLIDYASKTKPPIVIFESVRSGGTMGASLMRELWLRLREQTGLDYHFTDVFMNAASVGGDVIRPRYFFVAHLRPFGVDLPHGTPKDLIDVIGDLGPADGTRLDPGVDLAWGHVTNGSSSDTRIRLSIELLRSGGYDWAQGNRLPEHLKVWAEEMGHGYPDFWYGKTGNLLSHAVSDNMYSPFRWRTNKPMGVVTGGFMDRAVHPIEARPFTYREGARFMGLPDDWSLWPIASAKRDSWLGKAIPVASGRWIGTWARGSLEGSPGEYAGELVEDKHRIIDVSNRDKVRLIERDGGADVWWPDPIEKPRTVYLPEPVGRGVGRPEDHHADEPTRVVRRGRPPAVPRAPRTAGEARAPRERVVTGPIERVAPSVVLALLEELALSRGEAADALGVSRSRIAELVTDRKPGSWLNAERWDETQGKLRDYASSPRTM